MSIIGHKLMFFLWNLLIKFGFRSWENGQKPWGNDQKSVNGKKTTKTNGNPLK